MSNINQTIDYFNDTLIDLATNIADICPNSIIGDNIKLIKGIIKDPSNKTKILDIFVLKVLPYKPQIDNGDEEFFLRKSFDDDVSDLGDDSLSGKVFEFKNIWKGLKEENKQIVIQYMQILCTLAQDYFIYNDNRGLYK